MQEPKPTIHEANESHRLYSSEDEKAALEARNGLLQFDAIVQIVEESGDTLALTPGVIKQLHYLAIKDIYSFAGQFRDGEVGIAGAAHEPPHPDHVPTLIQEMCKYANQHQHEAIHVAAYLMWRMNWIHPFFDGNGRTSRAVSYLALSISLGLVLPGTPTIPDQIVSHREPYYQALLYADSACDQGLLDLRRMEELISTLLERQLGPGHGLASG